MKFSLLFKSLLANRLKSALIFTTLTVTVVAIFLISAISHGIISMYSTMLESDGDIIVTQAKISDTFFSNVDRSLTKKIKKIQGVLDVYSMIVGASPVENLPIVAIYGVSANKLPSYKLIDGSYPKRHEVVIGEALAQKLSSRERIQIADQIFRISGIYKSEIGFEKGGVVMNIEDASKLFSKSASMLLVSIDIRSDKEEIIKAIKGLSSKIDVKTTQNFVQNYNQFKIIRRSAFVISFIAFVMGLIAIGSIMSITVVQRRDEIGILKAIGMERKYIAAIILAEGLMLTIFAYIAALLLSLGALFAIDHIQMLQGYVDGKITPMLAFFVALTSVAMTLLGSLIPTVMALRVDPVVLIQRGSR